MSKDVHVYSTLTSPNRYTLYAKGDVPRPERSVLIEGGANVANKNFITPRGVVTTITAEDYAFLKDSPMFQLHVKNGFITVEERKVDVEKGVADLESRDESAPLTKEDYEIEGKDAPVSNKVEAQVATPNRSHKKR